MRIKLSDHFTYSKLLRFVAPCILMMVFTSIYGVVDGLFISNFAGKTPFAAINLIMPFLMIMGSFGFMIGTGGSAIISKTLGENKKDKANEYFSFLIYFTATLGVVLTIVGEIVLPTITRLFKATDDMYDYCITYGRIILITIPFFMLQNVFQSLFTTAEKPTIGFIITIVAGVTNMILDALFVWIFDLGVAGAAIATSISQIVGGIVPIIYFSRKNSSLLSLGKGPINLPVLAKTCTNGSSEFISNVSASFVSILYNYQLLKLAGEDGVATYGVLMYVNFIFVAIFIGYSIGTAPIIGYNLGAQNNIEQKNIFKKSMLLMAIIGVTMTILCFILASPLAYIFFRNNAELSKMTRHAFYLFSLAFIFSGYGIYGSSMFTALNNGLISVIISVTRTLVFQTSTILILPVILGLDGVWLSLIVADILSAIVSIIFCICFRKKYNYA